MLRCIAAYHTLRETVGDDDLRKHLPPSVLASEEEVRMAASPLYDFLKNGDDFYDVLHEEDAVTPLAELRKAFLNHDKVCRQDGAVWTGDHHPIKMAGYKVARTHICKRCNKKAAKSTCGAHYDVNNRKRLWMVVGMRLLKKQEPQYFDF